mmetsp:Transcript_42225/g.106503  ORF Transcript_42225/g.106503 Transcript_42225/m.106503 type:complete len:1277 (-) Transcript_42225:108-3938(-)|eukprot:CAMPEP_0177631174 /NCGR_PEP_ID=MMETSP0447-20121125/1605_1 /TAXON_ID=0 /ORGANISM="Stygamoeba regulata, Strain BSH-02190019" /LENGTH=1276 /DNA_ID=CAMNT_0019132633 /DNA_START=314 /DNA_END=4144 /DNA_ORIENTATION=+
MASPTACCVLLLLLTACAALCAGQEVKRCSSSVSWTTSASRIIVNDQHFIIRGVNYFGLETSQRCPFGLWTTTLSSILDFIENIGANAVRLPFSVEAIANNLGASPTCETWEGYRTDPGLYGKSVLDMMETIVDELGKRKIVVMLDQHRIEPANNISELWYTARFPESAVLDTWTTVMRRFQKKWNVFAIDLKNEPHGRATWGSGDVATDWNLAAQRIIKHVNSVAPDYKGLFFVEGVQYCQPEDEGGRTHGYFLGECLRGVYRNPIDVGAALNPRVVYSPHVYGPGVFPQAYFSDPTFPDNMPALWDFNWGDLRNTPARPVIAIGEWGSKYVPGSEGQVWMDAFASYMIRSGITDNFYWTVNPDSFDTGGLLKEDYATPETAKIRVLQNVVPNPTKVSLENGQVCVTGRGVAPSPSTVPSPTPSASFGVSPSATPSATPYTVPSPSASIAQPLVSPFPGTIIYVSNRGADTANCGARLTPCQSIARAVAAARTGSTVAIEPGNYTGPGNRNIPLRYTVNIRPASAFTQTTKRQFLVDEPVVIELGPGNEVAFFLTGAGAFGTIIQNITIIGGSPVESSFELVGAITIDITDRPLIPAPVSIRNCTFLNYHRAITVNGRYRVRVDNLDAGLQTCPVDLHVFGCSFTSPSAQSVDIVANGTAIHVDFSNFTGPGQAILTRHSCGESSLFLSLFQKKTRDVVVMYDGQRNLLGIDTCRFTGNFAPCLTLDGLTDLQVDDSVFDLNQHSIIGATRALGVHVAGSNFTANDVPLNSAGVHARLELLGQVVIANSTFQRNLARSQGTHVLSFDLELRSTVLMSNNLFLDNGVAVDVYLRSLEETSQPDFLNRLSMQGCRFLRSINGLPDGTFLRMDGMAFTLFNNTFGPTNGQAVYVNEGQGNSEITLNRFTYVAKEALRLTNGNYLLNITRSTFNFNRDYSIYSDALVELHMDNNLFALNRATAIRTEKVRAIFATSNNFTSNTAVGPGGAYHGNPEEDNDILFVQFANCTFIDNAGSEGGAIYTEHNILVDDSLFAANRASKGGAISFSGRKSRPVEAELENNLFTNNQADQGGGINLDHAVVRSVRSNFTFNRGDQGAAVHVDSRSYLLVRSAVIEENAGIRGGGLYIDDESQVVLRQTTIQLNTADFGAGVHITTASELRVLSGFLLLDNVAENNCGGLFCRSSYIDRCERIEVSLCDEDAGNLPQDKRCFHKCEVEYTDEDCDLTCKELNEDDSSSNNGKRELHIWVAALIYLLCILSVIVGIGGYICLDPEGAQL